jgi:predicted nucleic acid-binding protein
MVVSTDIMAEYDLRVPAVLAQEAPQTNARGALAWLRAKALWVEPAPLGRQRSRDLKDEKFLAAALSANAKATLLVAKAEIDAKDKVHVTPLYWAAEIGDTNMTKIGPLGPFGLDGSAPAGQRR